MNFDKSSNKVVFKLLQETKQAMASTKIKVVCRQSSCKIIRKDYFMKLNL